MILIHFKLNNWLSCGIFITKYYKIFDREKIERKEWRKKRVTLFQLLPIIVKILFPLIKEEYLFAIFSIPKVFCEICRFTCHQKGFICKIFQRLTEENLFDKKSLHCLTQTMKGQFSFPQIKMLPSWKKIIIVILSIGIKTFSKLLPIIKWINYGTFTTKIITAVNMRTGRLQEVEFEVNTF